MPGELVAVGDPDVGEAVGQQEAAVDALRREREGDLLGAPEPALAEVRRAAGVDLAEPLERGPAGVGRGQRARHDHVDPVVVDDDREPVVVVEAGDRLLDRLLREADLGAVHGARPVEDEGEVDGRPHPLGLRGRGRDLDEDETVAPVGRADEVTVGSDVRRSWLVLLEELSGDVDQALDPLVLAAAERSADVELDVRGEEDAVPLGAVGRGGRRA